MFKNLKAIDILIETRAQLCRMVIDNKFDGKEIIKLCEQLSKATNLVIENTEEQIKNEEGWL